MIKLGTIFANALLTTGSFKSLLDTGKLYIYSGPVPATADAAATGGTLLVTITNGGSGLTFATPAVNGVISKTAAETWSGVAAATGVAAYFRYCVGADTGSGAATTGNYRIQGTVGTDISSDMVVASTNYVSGDTKTLSNAQFAFPVS